MLHRRFRKNNSKKPWVIEVFWYYLVRSLNHMTWKQSYIIKIWRQDSISEHIFVSIPNMHCLKKSMGAFRESNSGPLAPKARIIPLDQMPNCWCTSFEATDLQIQLPLNLFCVYWTLLTKAIYFFCFLQFILTETGSICLADLQWWRVSCWSGSRRVHFCANLNHLSWK